MFEARISSLPFFSPSLFPFFVSVGGVGCERVKRQRRGRGREREKERNKLLDSQSCYSQFHNGHFRYALVNVA